MTSYWGLYSVCKDSPNLFEKAKDMRKLPPETKSRNSQIRRWLAKGLSYRYIASQLGISSGRVHQLVVKYEIFPVIKRY